MSCWLVLMLEPLRRGPGLEGSGIGSIYLWCPNDLGDPFDLCIFFPFFPFSFRWGGLAGL